MSISATNRQIGKHQVDEQRICILDAAEQLFLQNGLENTSMVDIATAAGITRVTLYRYFANRDSIAVEIQIRMLRKIDAMINTNDDVSSPESLRQRAQAMIRNFPQLQDAYRYIGMFDKIYLDNAPETALTQWTKDQLINGNWGRPGLREFHRNQPYGNAISVIFNNITWFLEKLALRGELTWSDKDVPLEENLRIFEDMIMGYFDRLMGSKEP